jgi:hypothetical protein
MLKIGTTGKPISNDFIIGELNKYDNIWNDWEIGYAKYQLRIGMI